MRERLNNVQNVDAPDMQGTLSPIVGLAPAASLSFGGFDSDDNAALFGFRVMPPDTEGDVGMTHYVQWNNLGFKIFLKDGSLLNAVRPKPSADFHGHEAMLLPVSLLQHNFRPGPARLPGEDHDQRTDQAGDTGDHEGRHPHLR